MNLKLIDLIEIVYPLNCSDEKKESINKSLNNLKIDNLFNINKKKLQKFFLVVNEERNILDFKVDPTFELISLNNEISNLENNDFNIINDGCEPFFHDNFHTNININVLNNDDLNTTISIKKLLQTMDYPDNLLDDVLEEEYNTNEDSLEYDYDNYINDESHEYGEVYNGQYSNGELHNCEVYNGEDGNGEVHNGEVHNGEDDSEFLENIINSENNNNNYNKHTIILKKKNIIKFFWI